MSLKPNTIWAKVNFCPVTKIWILIGILYIKPTWGEWCIGHSSWLCDGWLDWVEHLFKDKRNQDEKQRCNTRANEQRNSLLKTQWYWLLPRLELRPWLIWCKLLQLTVWWVIGLSGAAVRSLVMITDFKREAEKSYTPSRMGGVHVHQSLRKNLTATKTLAQVQRCDSEPTLLAWLMPSPILTPRPRYSFCSITEKVGSYTI